MLQEIEGEGERRDRSHWTAWSCLESYWCGGGGEEGGGEEEGENFYLKSHTPQGGMAKNTPQRCQKELKITIKLKKF